MSFFVCVFNHMCVQMWMSVLWALTVMITPAVRTQKAPTPAPVSTHTLEMAKTAQVIWQRSQVTQAAVFLHSFINPAVRVCSEPVKCENPGTPDFGRRYGSNFLMGSEVVFSCDNGYELIGSSQLQCLETGDWDDAVPYCRGESWSHIMLLRSNGWCDLFQLRLM